MLAICCFNISFDVNYISYILIIYQCLSQMEEGQIQNQLTKLKKHTFVVADTGDFNLIEKYHPEDSTTNPSLILQVAKKPQFKEILTNSIHFGLKHFQTYCGSKQKENTQVEWTSLNQTQKVDIIDLIFDHLCVSFGIKILEKIKGYVSTEVDATLSFNKNATIKRAERIIALYQQAGISQQRILIKIASTWQGIKAGEFLLNHGFKVNMTLIFHIVQAVACADSNLFLISPFAGRLLDWSKKEYGKTYENHAQDPGVVFVTDIFNYYKSHGIKTIIMGASFRNTGQIKEMCGCDRLTISPALLDDLKAANGQVPLKLDAAKAALLKIPRISAVEEDFRHAINSSKLATDLLSDGIRRFQKDGNQLKDIIRKNLEQGSIKKE